MTDRGRSGATLITGASRGIGEAVALRLAKPGVVLALNARTPERLEEVACQVQERGGVAVVLPADVTQPDQVEAMVSAARDSCGPLGLLVNNVGGNPSFKPVLDWSLDEWDRVMDLNLRSAFTIATSVARSMIADGVAGSLVNVSSVGGDVAVANTLPYCVAKAGLTHLTRGLALELAQYEIRVNAVAPGYVATDLTGRLRESPETLAALENAIPLGRLASVTEIAEVIEFLASATYMTGAIVQADGGFGLPRLWPAPRPARSAD